MNKKIRKLKRQLNPKPKTLRRKAKNLSRAMYRRLADDLYKPRAITEPRFVGILEILGAGYST